MLQKFFKKAKLNEAPKLNAKATKGTKHRSCVGKRPGSKFKQKKKSWIGAEAAAPAAACVSI